MAKDIILDGFLESTGGKVIENRKGVIEKKRVNLKICGKLPLIASAGGMNSLLDIEDLSFQ